MSSASSAVTYTSVYTDSEPGRVFWGADEEISDGGSPRVIVLGYDGLPMQPDEDEREPMFIQPHDPDYVPEPIYPEYIPLEDEHVFPVEEQPLPPVDSPTAESPGYVTELDPEEDQEEDDADDEDEDEEEGEEEHPAPADSAIVIPTVEPVSPPKGIEPVIPPPSTDITTTGARITVQLQASISTVLQRQRCTAPPTLSSPPPVPSPLLQSSGCPTQIQTLRMASTQALVDAVTGALPSPLLLPLPPSLYIPPPVNRRNDLPESERATSLRDTLGGSAAEREFLEIAPMTLGEVNTRVTKLVELHERDTKDLYALIRQDSIDYGGGGLCFLRGLGSLNKIESGDPSGALDPP
ncbi:hypothetical protein Tco_0872013 [Tanacetum coccineum]